MIINLCLILISFGGGVAVGSAAAAFITILQIVPRLAQITDTKKHINIYQSMIISSFILFVILYLSNFSIRLPNVLVVSIGLFQGIFIGVLSSALAEVLNVIPVMSKKLKIKDDLRYVVWSLMGGKVLGSLYFWLFYK